MSNKKMHADELEIDEALVKQLLDEQFPEWAKLPLSVVQSAGTDNAIYRLGTNMCIRLPRRPDAGRDNSIEQKWLQKCAPILPLSVPILLAKGNSSEKYPYHWSICRWLEGENAFKEPIVDLGQAANDLAQFLIALRQIDTRGGPASSRGVELATQDTETRNAIASLQGIIDAKEVTEVWQECLQAPVWNKSPVWIHGDLLPTNLLVNQGRLSGVIDFDFLGIGDPACDLLPAWSIFSGKSRDIFRTTLQVDDATWMRGRGWALSVALIILPYYWKTNPVLVAIAQRMISEILANS